MKLELRDKFIQLWSKYFGDSDLPMVYYYTNDDIEGELVERNKDLKGYPCFLSNLSRVIEGEDLRFSKKSFGCPGALAYTGFQELKMPNFEYFLSCGIEGKMEGERYKRTPELAMAYKNSLPEFKAPKEYLVFKRWDKLTEKDNPEVVVFFAKPDVLSGLFTLSNFEDGGLTNVVAPFVAGCGSMILLPSTERLEKDEKTYLGMFDVSARPSVPSNTLSFAMSIERFERMIDCMEESFVITRSWDKVKERMDTEFAL